MKLSKQIALSAMLCLIPALLTTAALGDDHKIRSVLVISVDGMHAVDFKNCVNGISTINNGAPYCPALAALGKTGINYEAASTSKTSDSFPGLTAIVTGGSPAFTGVYYDVAYARNYDAPTIATGNGVQPGPCTAGAPPRSPGETVPVSIRQHDIDISISRPQAAENVVQATVVRQVFLGGSRDYMVETPDGTTLRIVTSTESPVPRGTEVWLTLPPERCRALSR